MQTLNLQEASDFLKIHPVTLARMARRGDVPSRKVGKRWLFLDDNLAVWLNGDYSNLEQGLRVVDKEKKCQSTNVVKIRPGGYNSQEKTADEYSDLLGLK